MQTARQVSPSLPVIGPEFWFRQRPVRSWY
jgi:hypothetical protein